MQGIATLTERGVLTLPARIRQALGITGKQQFLIEAISNGEIMLKPAFMLPKSALKRRSKPVEIEGYTEERISEFLTGENEIADWLKAKLKKYDH